MVSEKALLKRAIPYGRPWLEEVPSYEPLQTNKWNTVLFIAEFGTDIDQEMNELYNSESKIPLERTSEIETMLTIPRSDATYEEFFFSTVTPLIVEFRYSALAWLDALMSSDRVPRAAKYHYASTLGHIRDEQTDALRRDYILWYRKSGDEGLRDGAEDAAEFLELI